MVYVKDCVITLSEGFTFIIMVNDYEVKRNKKKLVVADSIVK